MNAKRLLCILLVSSAPLLLRAQRMEQLTRENPFSTGRNICGQATLATASYAEIYTGTEQGGFRPGYSSSDIWRAGARAATRGYFGDTFLLGRFGFEQMHGKDMMTSMFINPGYYPVDVLEFTPGDKTLQTYSFSGGLSYQLTGRLSLGALVDFKAQNYSKRKDIRHTNYGLDLSFVPSVLYHVRRHNCGLSLVLRETAESIEAEQVGAATADTYYAFFDKGLRYGTWQAWDGSGIHLAESGVGRLPVREYSYGGALQYCYTGKDLSLYADGEYLRTSGLVGEKGYDWYRFPGNKVAANLILSHVISPMLSGRFSFRFDLRGQRVEEAAWDRVTTGGVTVPEVYGYNTVSRRRHASFTPVYQLRFRDNTVRSLRLGYMAVVMDEQASPLYPCTDRWHAVLSRANVAAVTGLPFDGALASRFSLTLGARLLWANDSSDGLQPAIPDAGEGSALQPAAEPFRLVSDWVRKREYMTSGAWGLDAGVTYQLAALRGMYLGLDISWTHAFVIENLLGKNRWTAALRLGYDF